MTPLARKAALALLAAGPTLAACSKKADVAVGSKDFTEELILGEMYAQLLEHDGLTVERKLNLGGTQVAMEALQRGDIDLYPEYTGTALLAILKLPRPKTARETYELVSQAYNRRYNLTWLDPAPMNDTQALATTAVLAQRYRIFTLSQLSFAAPQLRLGSIPEFLKRDDGLPGLRRAYGGFNFKSIKLFDIGLKYEALITGNVDVVVAFGTDGQIAADQLVVFADDKHFWPTYQVAPVVRQAALAAHPQIAPSLNRLGPLLTDTVMRALNYQVDGQHQEPADVAGTFLKKSGLA
jgi:osmoprotectant transport system substrate-binding protein